MEKPKHIPQDVFDRIMLRFMKYIRRLELIYKTANFKKHEVDEMTAMIFDIVDSYFEQFPYNSRFPKKIFIKQLKTYFLEMYLYPQYLTKTQIGDLMGYKRGSKSTHRHSMVTYNCQVIQDYLDTKDKKWSYGIIEIDEKIKEILI